MSAPRRPRKDLIPNANNPRLLLRLVHLVASGVRKERPLSELLEVDLRTVHYYTQAGEWLGLLSTVGEVHLTDAGMRLAFAEPKRRMPLYAEAVWRNEFASDILRRSGALVDVDLLANYIQEREPTMARATARRRATAVRSLLEPAIGKQPRSPQAQGVQMSLAFPPRVVPPPLEVRMGERELVAGKEENPDVYAALLRALLDNAELGTHHLRSLLDSLAPTELPLPGYVAMFLRRGDAVRIDDRLVLTDGGRSRADMADDPALVAFTDPDYRAYLDEVMAKGKGPLPLRNRFQGWDLRILGEKATPEAIRRAADQRLVGRQLAGLAVARPGEGATFEPAERPFLDSMDLPGLAICFPGALADLAPGVAEINRQLARVKQAPMGVRAPSPLEHRVRWHGGLFHPGESAPQSIPDTVSLRVRLLTHTPALALLGALLLLGRRPDSDLTVALTQDAYTITWNGSERGELLAALASFGQAQGWRVSRGRVLRSTDLALVAQALGLATRLDGRLHLDEGLFVALQDEPELHMVYEALQPLVDRLHAWLDRGSP